VRTFTKVGMSLAWLRIRGGQQGWGGQWLEKTMPLFLLFFMETENTSVVAPKGQHGFFAWCNNRGRSEASIERVACAAGARHGVSDTTGSHEAVLGTEWAAGKVGRASDHPPIPICLSPHLVQVRERIRINGQPISPELFTKYFWRLYHRLEETKDDSSCVSMPGYFRFLTLMAFHVFLQEKVDLAVMEVGIGGAYDCTNIVKKPVVCGVSSLGIDHTGLLGDTMEKIAWQKGGIFKCGIPAFTVLQPDGPLAVLRDRAQQISCPLYLCPPLEALEEGGPLLTLGLEGEHQQSNAALALQLARCWLQQKGYQGNGSEVRVLLFNSTGDRDSAALLKLLQPCQFDYTIFCPNLTEVSSTDNADQQNFTVTLDQVLLRCLAHQQHWSRLHEDQASPEAGGPAPLLLAPRPAHTHSTSSLVFSCISHALQWISQGRDPVFQPTSPPRVLFAHPVAGSGAIVLQEAAAIHVLVTGSLHLVGGVLKLLEPSLSQ
ncbi:hypothetical protein E2I00_002035, partial [Balaenoptera physalus]